MEDEKCDFCGEEKRTIKILDPNFDSDGTWMVCKRCDRFIKDKHTEGINELVKNSLERAGLDNEV